MTNKALIEYRESLAKSQREMAEMLGISLSYYSKVEQGKRNGSLKFVQKFKTQFPNADIDQIFFEEVSHLVCDEPIN